MRFRPAPTDDEALSVIAWEPIGFVSAEQYRADRGRGMFRPEWTWVAEDAGRIVARAVWWGRADGTHPLVLDCLWVDATVTDPADVAGRLLNAAHQHFPERPDSFMLTMANDWHDDPAARAAVAWRRAAAAKAMFTHEVERLQFAWTPDVGVPEPDGRLVFVAEPDDVAVREVFRRIGDGSLDDETRKNRARTGPEDTARQDMEFYLKAPGRRDWWRTAHTPEGSLVGLAVPSATSRNLNVGFLGVVPEHRGRGYVRSILDEITRSQADRGADRITATTDLANRPMVAAFRHAGYRNTETRVLLSPP